MNSFRLTHPNARRLAADLCREAPDGTVVTFKEARRSDEQSRLMHSMARDLDEQVPWCGQRLGVDGWKRFAVAKLKKDRIVFDCNDKGEPDPHGGFVVLAKSTADMPTREINEVIAWFEWMGAQHSVQWTHEAAKVAQLEATARR